MSDSSEFVDALSGSSSCFFVRVPLFGVESLVLWIVLGKLTRVTRMLDLNSTYER